jgi:hypothetical protein
MSSFESDRSRETFENLLFTVTPAKAGVQNVLKSLDSGFHRNDDLSSFGRNSKVSQRICPEFVSYIAFPIKSARTGSAIRLGNR